MSLYPNDLDPVDALNMNQNGFTLIEMMIVIAIIAIMAAIAIPQYRAFYIRSQRVEAELTLRNVHVAELGYFSSFDTFKVGWTADVNNYFGIPGITPHGWMFQAYYLPFFGPANNYSVRLSKNQDAETFYFDQYVIGYAENNPQSGVPILVRDDLLKY